MAAGVHSFTPGAGRHVLEMTLMKKISYYHISKPPVSPSVCPIKEQTEPC